jgi:PAS domain S-box-containing protein
VNQLESASPIPRSMISLPSNDNFLATLSKGLDGAVFAIELSLGSVMYWNEVAEELFQYTANEMLDQSIERLFADRSAFDFIATIVLPQIENEGFWRGDLEYLRRDGSQFIRRTTGIFFQTDTGNYATLVMRQVDDENETKPRVQRSPQVRAQPVGEAPTLIDAAMKTKKLGTVRNHAGELLEMLLQHSNSCVILLLTPEGQVALWNRGAEQVFGYTSAEIDIVHFSSFYRADPKEAKWKEILEGANVENCVRDDGWLVRKDGSQFYASVEAIACRDKSAALYGYLILLRDDTEQRQLRMGMNEKEHMATIGTTTAMLAHEIKNPLNGMSTTVQLLERSLRNDVQITKENLITTVHDLKNEIARLQSLLGDFQTISHPQRLTLQSVDLREIMHEVLALGIPGSLKQKIVVVEEYAPDLPQIQGDANKLKQAFLNLVKNSCEAMRAGGTLTAKAFADEEGVRVEIIDTGEGIPEGLDVFQPFRSTKADGTGLGLVIVRQIVLAHSGSIYYSSQPGRNTAFRVILPV